MILAAVSLTGSGCWFLGVEDNCVLIKLFASQPFYNYKNCVALYEVFRRPLWFSSNRDILEGRAAWIW